MKPADQRPFHFKRFSMFQDRCAMKIGTDGAMLGAWAQIEDQGSAKVLDIGTGTGLLALMLAQRNDAARIDAIEIDSAAASQAEENVAGSDFSHQIRVYNCSLQSWKPQALYDHIVSNPPFYRGRPKSPNAKRSQARHDDSLPVETLVECVVHLLSANGRFSVVWPAEREAELLNLFAGSHLTLQRRCEVYPSPSKPCHRVLLTLGTSPTSAHRFTAESITIEQFGRGGFSPTFLRLLREYYLDF